MKLTKIQRAALELVGDHECLVMMQRGANIVSSGYAPATSRTGEQGWASNMAMRALHRLGLAQPRCALDGAHRVSAWHVTQEGLDLLAALRAQEASA